MIRTKSCCVVQRLSGRQYRNGQSTLSLKVEDVAEDSKGKVFNKSPSVMSPAEKPALKVKNNVIWLSR